MKNKQPLRVGKLLSFLEGKFSTKITSVRGLGCYFYEGKVYLYYQVPGLKKNSFHVATSTNGLDFELYKDDASINYPTKKKEIISDCYDFIISRIDDAFHLTYKKKTGVDYIKKEAYSKDLLKWKFRRDIAQTQPVGQIVENYQYKNEYSMYAGEATISLFTSPDLEKWEQQQEVLAPREDKFDNAPLEPEYVLVDEQGVVLVYHSKKHTEKTTHHSVGVAMYDRDNPAKMLWRSSLPLWEQEKTWDDQHIHPIGVVKHEGRLISYWQIDSKYIYAVIYTYYQSTDGLLIKNPSILLKKPPHNPILSPKKENSWEAFNTFNPAAVYADNKVHLLYRAQGHNYVSVIGYASSSDGYHISERDDEPCYIPTEPFEYVGEGKPTSINHLFMSGGGYGGCEDPRITQIGDRLYMTYVAYDGFNPPRVALTSIALNDFLNRRWLWERPVLISPPGVVDKNACILPEKVNGKYVIFHRIYPDILIDFVEDLDFDGKKWLKGEHKISPRPDMWDSRKIGVGAPPIKTRAGWLLIYQAVGNQDSGKYKIGAMLLDLNDPTKVLHRSRSPILEPTHWYENEGFKSGVAYPCGAVIIGDTLFVYYGGADQVVCVATANLDNFLDLLQHDHLAKLEPAIIYRVL